LLKKYLHIIIPAIFCLVCCAFPLMLYLMLNQPPEVADVRYTVAEGEIILPELLYISEEEAVQKLNSLGLRAVTGTKAHHQFIPEQHVLTQNPPAGAVLTPGDVVTLTVSDGWTEYVPDVTDMLKEKAIEKLESLGFSVSCSENSSISSAPGTVISQSFAADSKIPIGTTISLVISTGRANTDPTQTEIVGNYIGMDFEDAKNQLSELNLYALQIDTVYDPDIPNGTIISQDISAGTQVAQGTSIKMKVSLGQVTVHVPECAGQNTSDARKLLEDAGLTCMVIYTPSSDYPLDYVISQNEAPGSSVALGSQVWLTASVGSSSYVISTGGWSGNPLPSFTSEPETEPPTEAPETLPEDIMTDIYEDAPEIIEPEPEIPEIDIDYETAPVIIEPEIIDTDPIIETTPDGYQDAPETAPF